MYVAAAGLEFLITALMVLFYILKLNKTITFFFWPLVVSEAAWRHLLQHEPHASLSFFFLPQDVCNSVFAATYFCILSLMVLGTQTVVGALFGGVRHVPQSVQHSLLFPELQRSIITFWLFECFCRSWVLWWSGCCVQTASCSSRTSHWTSHAVKPTIQIQLANQITTVKI